ncbi:GAF and ANTAR domain-containing protein [uncultured Nocardioides sp.]|uniref:GAF and ANTAR domain-containing protein n=1 Tax=uncultured Nocardioides sp. TaxID=198441 RepID=UPI0026218E6E|nr:GAF and ANTAR domain-containing protein [uncultured Nocardioides sp.]
MTMSLDAIRSELNASLSSAAPGLSTADALCATCVGVLDVDGAAMSVILDGASSGTFGSSNETSRRLDEYQFTFGEGPCLDAVTQGSPVLVPDLEALSERRWPAFRDAVLSDGIRGVFAVPIVVTSECVGALDLYRVRPGPLDDLVLAGAHLAAELATAPLLDLLAEDVAAEAGRQDGAEDDPLTRRDADGGTSEMDRVEVYQATGMLISALDVDADEALLRLRAHAISSGLTATEVARAIIERRLVLDRDDRPGSPGSSRPGGSTP